MSSTTISLKTSQQDPVHLVQPMHIYVGGHEHKVGNDFKEADNDYAGTYASYDASSDPDNAPLQTSIFKPFVPRHRWYRRKRPRIPSRRS